jgi:hypothetical protein
MSEAVVSGSCVTFRIYNDNIDVGPFSNKIPTWDKVVSEYLQVFEKTLEK